MKVSMKSSHAFKITLRNDGSNKGFFRGLLCCLDGLLPMACGDTYEDVLLGETRDLGCGSSVPVKEKGKAFIACMLLRNKKMYLE